MMGSNKYEKTEKEIRVASNVESIIDVISKHRLKWFGHISRMNENNWIRKCLEMEIEGKRERGRPAKKWLDLVNKDMKENGIGQLDAKNRVLWRSVTKAKRPNSSF
jgi:enoyl reductase-like protein